MNETTDSSPLNPHALTQELARANILSLDSLDANQAGHLSSQQMKVVLETFGFAILIPVVFLGMIGAGAVGIWSLQQGFSDQNFSSLAEGCVLLPVCLLCLIGTGLLINQTKRTGTDKYLSQRRFIRLLMMPIDLIRGHVTSVEGSTASQVTETSTGDHSSMSDTNYYYSYRVAGTNFEVSEEGYHALPRWGMRCRVYYLPLSKALLNIEVMDTAPLNVQAPDTTADDIQNPSTSASGAQTPDKVAALNRRAARTQEGIAFADSIIRPLANLSARLAFGGSKASEIDSRLSHMPSSMPFNLTSSPIYAQALQIARADSRVLAELGEPIQPLPNVTGSTHRTNDIVVTELTIPISGAHKHATLYAAAREKNGELEFYQLEVKVGGKADVIPLGG